LRMKGIRNPMKFLIPVIASFVLTIAVTRFSLGNAIEQSLRLWLFWIGISAAAAGTSVIYFSGIGQIFRYLRKLTISVILQWAFEKTGFSGSRQAKWLQWLGLTHSLNGDGKVMPDFSHIDEILMLAGWSAVSIGAALIFTSR